ncbi:aspartate aminotransferase family protein [Mycobacteroides salmoniphilum]|uniref:Taurine--pyruvate aminotransferase n=1 Tax=Mycobacteroides salmoniphilum TaxID=404941 RepID=A0A4R8SDH2_9MYCO|nr:aspartate aminotransferase family protein [Mycobacteroides salmoniphilum]TDZ93507.1 Taurine--pyruvate aminotransferase [Mycobacteroides salmoniphilum]TEA09290.1 Taurine--pyruvate aminotransferase [Mycobacteroides salmoniphilum]
MSSRTYELDRAHVFHSWSAQAELTPMVIAGAQGSWVWDEHDNRFLDFSSQLVYTNAGHQHPRILAAIKAQVDQLCTVAPQHANAARSQAARLIAEIAPPGMNRIFFTNGGADANEHAVRMARLHTGRPKILTAYRSYHGGTQTAINLTGDPRRFPNDSGSSGVARFFGPFTYRSEFGARTDEQECVLALRHLGRVIEAEGPETIAAILLETIPGTAGIMMPPDGYLEGVRELCNRHGILLILDEVMAGFGRAGNWLALDHWGISPDLITFAKGVNSGYVPMGGVVVGDAVYDTFAHRPYPGGLTYSGHPLAAAAAVATLQTMAAEDIVGNAERIGAGILGTGLRELAGSHPCVGEVRGTGVFWAIELVVDRDTREPLHAGGSVAEATARIVGECKSRGLLPFATANRIHVVPPCTITEAEVQLGLEILDKALTAGDDLTVR